MAHHGRTPASVLEAPSQSVVQLTTPAGPNRAARRHTDRVLRLAAPRRVWLPRARTERPVHPEALLAQQARRAAAFERRVQQKIARDARNEARTAAQEASPR